MVGKMGTFEGLLFWVALSDCIFSEETTDLKRVTAGDSIQLLLFRPAPSTLRASEAGISGHRQTPFGSRNRGSIRDI
jgi:hypothetical protein